jgi:hypothetical protein
MRQIMILFQIQQGNTSEIIILSDKKYIKYEMN